MKADVQLRWVQPSHVPGILAIYAPYVLNTTTSFETEVPTHQDFEQRVMEYAAKSPWIVAMKEDKVVGYAYATAHRSRGAYRWNQETTVYVHPDHRKQGIARTLYTQLLSLLQTLGHSKAIAVITLPNDASILFHQSCGFEHIGDMPDIGFKFNQWHTTSWWHKVLQPEGYVPGDIQPIESVRHILG